MKKPERVGGGIVFVSNCRLHSREQASVSLGFVGPGWGPLCALGFMSASPIVKMETDMTLNPTYIFIRVLCMKSRQI